MVADWASGGPPVDGVEVEILETGERVPVSDDGSFLFNGLGGGPYRLRILYLLLGDRTVNAPVNQLVHTVVGEVTYVRLRLPTVSQPYPGERWPASRTIRPGSAN